MFKLDNAFLEELGLGSLPPVEKNKMLAHIYETLEMRVGMKLAEQMSNEQLDEFEAYINKKDESGALKWLENNFPNYKQVVADELEKLKEEIKQAAPQIVAQSEESSNGAQQAVSGRQNQVAQPRLAVSQQQPLQPKQPVSQDYLNPQQPQPTDSQPSKDQESEINPQSSSSPWKPN